MKKFFVQFLMAIAFTGAITAQNNYWQQDLSYKIDVTLNDKLKTLKGFESIVYKNNSPNTLDFIWFHIWPNAYANQNTTLFKQIKNDASRKEKLKKVTYGNITGLQFKVNNVVAKTEPHTDPQNIDIIKVILPKSLQPGESCTITTPFNVKLPNYFSRSGFADGEFMICQWYPKPAVYDAKGWNEFPYLDMGEFYAEYGTFNVNITLPAEYIVSATGTLNTKDELGKYKTLGAVNSKNREKAPQIYKVSKPNTQKTLNYTAENVPDFAFFADKKYLIHYDTLALPSGKIIDAFSFFYNKPKTVWKNSLDFVEDATRKYSSYMDEYPYPTVQAVEGPKNNASGGMEYPMVTLITSPDAKESSLDAVIAHEVGHNWFMSILGSNERVHGWMDEGLNTYFQLRYEGEKYRSISLFGDEAPEEMKKLDVDKFMGAVYSVLKTIPMEAAIETHSADFKNSDDYGMTIYMKTAVWMYALEKKLGKEVVAQGFADYFNNWKFKHPQPSDFKVSMEKAAGKKLDEEFEQLNKKGKLTL